LEGTKRASARTRQLTLAAVFAAVYFILRALPTFQMVGTSGYFTAGDFFLTTIALISGPWSGTLAVLVGTIAAYAVRPPIFFGLDFLPAIANVSIAGFLLSGRWRAAIGVYVVILVAFLVSPYSLLFGYDGVPYVWLHLVAFAILLSPISWKIPVWIRRLDVWGVIAIAILAFVGTLAQHLVGGILYEFTIGYVGGLSPEHFMSLWRIIFWLYPTERIVIVTISTVVALGVYRSFESWRSVTPLGTVHQRVSKSEN
jgi:hypothetical protein